MGFQEKRPVIVELLCRAKFNKKINCCSNHLSCLYWSKLSRRINNIITLRLRRKTRGSKVTGATASPGAGAVASQQEPPHPLTVTYKPLRGEEQWVHSLESDS